MFPVIDACNPAAHAIVMINPVMITATTIVSDIADPRSDRTLLVRLVRITVPSQRLRQYTVIERVTGTLAPIVIVSTTVCGDDSDTRRTLKAVTPDATTLAALPAPL